MNIVDQIIQSLKKFADFSTRASRAEFWTFFFFVFFISALARLFGPLASLIGLLLFLPQVAVAIRRLHDVNRTGRELIVPVIMLVCSPLVFMFGSFLGQIVQLGYAGLTLIMFGQLLLLLTRKGSIVPNRYGACPTAFSFGR